MKKLFVVMVVLLGAMALSATGAHAGVNYSFLFSSAKESKIGRGVTFFGEKKGITYSQKPTERTLRVMVVDNNTNHNEWMFSIVVPVGRQIVPGVYNTQRGLTPDGGMAMDMSMDGRWASVLEGRVEILEIVYSDGVVVKLAINFLSVEDGDNGKWNYAEIRMNTEIPHTVPPHGPKGRPAISPANTGPITHNSSHPRKGELFFLY